MHDGAPHPAQRFIRAGDEFGTRLGEHLDDHIVGNQFLLDQFTDKIEIGLRGGRKPHLDFLEADFYQHVEHAAFSARVHGLDQRLVAVAQIHAAPRGRCGND